MKARGQFGGLLHKMKVWAALASPCERRIFRTAREGRRHTFQPV
jgi:hypothetical protein